jgi:hypothetical protein
MLVETKSSKIDVEKPYLGSKTMLRFGQDNFELTVAVVASPLKEQSLLSCNLLTDCLMNLWIDQGFDRGG